MAKNQHNNCQTPDLGQGLEFDFTFANNKKNNNKNNNNPHLNFPGWDGTRGLKFEQPKHNPTDVMLSKSPEQRVERGSEVLNFVLLGSEDDQTREVVKNGRSDTWLGD